MEVIGGFRLGLDCESGFVSFFSFCYADHDICKMKASHANMSGN